MHVSLQLGYQNKCDIVTVLLSEDLNVVDGVDKYQCVELLNIIGCKQENNACHGSLPAPPAQTKTTWLNCCLRASMRAVLAFSMCYITIDAKLSVSTHVVCL